MEVYDNLIYRRQFFISPVEVDSFSEWKSHKLDCSLYVYSHPDLEYSHARSDFGELLCFGIFVDYISPDISNSKSLENINNSSKSIEEVILKTFSFSGRWLCIFVNRDGGYIFNDPVGARQFYYSFSEEGLWGASQPHTIANELNLEVTRNTEVLDFIENDLFSTGEAFWVNDGTSYDSIKHLPPNHYLKIANTNEIVRYWPSSKIKKSKLGYINQKSKNILHNIYHGLTSKYMLIQAITAGWDSRVLLAASKPYRKNIEYYIHAYSKVDLKSNDIIVATELADYLNIPFSVINCNKVKDHKFKEILKSNISILHNESKADLYYNYFTNYQGKLNISGYAGEIPRLRYGNDRVSRAEDLAFRVGVSQSPYIIGELQKWIDKNIDICDKHDILLTDLFYWEVKMGNWGSQFPSEMDIAIEEFYPLNCRDFIVLNLSAEEDQRTSYNPMIFLYLIKSMWRKVLKYPINHIDAGTIIRRRNRFKLYDLLKKLHIYNGVKYIIMTINPNYRKP